MSDAGKERCATLANYFRHRYAAAHTFISARAIVRASFQFPFGYHHSQDNKGRSLCRLLQLLRLTNSLKRTLRPIVLIRIAKAAKIYAKYRKRFGYTSPSHPRNRHKGRTALRTITLYDFANDS